MTTSAWKVYMHRSASLPKVYWSISNARMVGSSYAEKCG
jgi:hypothetical protein